MVCRIYSNILHQQHFIMLFYSALRFHELTVDNSSSPARRSAHFLHNVTPISKTLWWVQIIILLYIVTISIYVKTPNACVGVLMSACQREGECVSTSCVWEWVQKGRMTWPCTSQVQKYNWLLTHGPFPVQATMTSVCPSALSYSHRKAKNKSPTPLLHMIKKKTTKNKRWQVNCSLL